MGMSKSAPRSIEQLLRWVSLVGEDGAQALTGAAASFWVLWQPPGRATLGTAGSKSRHSQLGQYQSQGGKNAFSGEQKSLKYCFGGCKDQPSLKKI